VIVVVKADGYGHGAIESALHLADHVGADAFAVATLEEGIALRRAFETTPPTSRLKNNPVQRTQQQQQHLQNQQNLSSLPRAACLTNHHDLETRSTGSSRSTHSQTTTTITGPARSLRPPQIRIIVLGPPVGYPRCFDDYYHHGIEVMCSGPEVAKAMVEWITDEKERKRTQVERAANDAKAAALSSRPAARDTVVNAAKAEIPVVIKALQRLPSNGTSNGDSEQEPPSPPATVSAPSCDDSSRTGSIPVKKNEATSAAAAEPPPPPPQTAPAQLQQHQSGLSATLGNVSGQDLAKEVRTFLMNQLAAKAAQENATVAAQNTNGSSTNETQTCITGSMTADTTSRQDTMSRQMSNVSAISGNGSMNPGSGQTFGGIEAAAKSSRTRELVAARTQGFFREDSGDDTPTQSVANPTVSQKMIIARKRLRYHVLVDSGMGRLGFKTQAVEVSDVGVRRDTVEIISELVDLEVNGAPIGESGGWLTTAVCFLVPCSLFYLTYAVL